MAHEPADRFRVLFDLTYARIVAYARRRVPASDVDDVVAEVFVTAWRRWSELDDDRDPVPWLYGVANNVVRNEHRSAGRRSRLLDRAAGVADGVPRSLMPDPADEAARGDERAQLRLALSRLGEDDQEILRLAVWDGLSHDTIGDLLGIKPGTVSVRLHRARNRLAVELGEPER